MKQIIGYMEYDYLKIKYGMRFMVLLFIVISGIFASKSALGAIGYILFGAMILTSTMFQATEQTVSLGALVPGSTLQKVLGRHLMELVMIAAGTLLGLFVVKAAELAGCDNGGIEPQLLAALVGITLLLLAFQNVMLYLFVPILGMQFANIIRMVPGFILFFFVMNEKTINSISAILREAAFPGVLMLGIGAACLLFGTFLSYAIERKRRGR